MTRKSHRHPPLPTTYEHLYADLRSESLPDLRRHNQLSNYGLLHTWRHPLPSHPNPLHTLSPFSRQMHRLDDLFVMDLPIQVRWQFKLPKNAWKMRDPIKELGISTEIRRLRPEGTFAKKSYLVDVRQESKITRCRDGYCCFRVWAKEAWSLKEKMKREVEEDAREFWAGEGDVLEVPEVTEGGSWKRELVWPRRDWGVFVDQARVSRRLRSGSGKRERVEVLDREEDEGGSGKEDGKVVDGEGETEDLGDGEEWALVECLGHLSDVESWDADFESVQSGYCSA